MVRGPVQSLATARGTGEAACPGLSSSSCPYLALILSPPQSWGAPLPSQCSPSISTPRSPSAPLTPQSSPAFLLHLLPESRTLIILPPMVPLFPQPGPHAHQNIPPEGPQPHSCIVHCQSPLPRSAAPSLFHHSISQPGSLPHSLQPPPNGGLYPILPHSNAAPSPNTIPNPHSPQYCSS